MARVVIIMPVYNEAAHLQAVLESVGAQDVDHTRLFFIAVDGASSDASVSIIENWLAASDIRGIVLSNPRRKIPIALNLGLEHVRDDDVVVRLDGHTLYGEQYLSNALRALECAGADVGCVGGTHVPVPCAAFEKRVVEALYTNPMGLGGADFRRGNHVRETDQVYLGVWRPGVLQAAGGFNEMLEANEDGEMSARIRSLGYRILRVPLPCRFIVNRGVWGSVRQWHRYGFWRAKMLSCNPAFVRKRHAIVPAAALLAVALAASPWRLVLVPLFVAYAGCVYFARAKGEPLPVTLATLVFFPVLQFAYALGLISGLLTGSRSVRRPVAAKLNVAADQVV